MLKKTLIAVLIGFACALTASVAHTQAISARPGITEFSEMSGVVGADQGGAGTVNGVLQADGAGNVSAFPMGSGVAAALGNTAGGASGFAVLSAGGLLPIAQGGTNASTAETALQNLSGRPSFRPVTVCDNSTDNGAIINASITAALAAGGGDVWLPACTALKITTSIALKRTVHLIGAGTGATIFQCAVATCFSGDTNQMYDISLERFSIQPFSGFSGSIAIDFPNMQLSNIGPLELDGFTAANPLIIDGGTTAATVYNSNLGGNTIFNHWHDIAVYGCVKCFVIRGQDNGTGAGPDAPYPPLQVNTHNLYQNVNLYYVTGIGYEITRDADTNVWQGGLVSASVNGVYAVVLGSSGLYPAGNVYVGNMKFFGFATSGGGMTGVTMFNSNHKSPGLEVLGFNTDVDLDTSTLVQMPYADTYKICGTVNNGNAVKPQGSGCVTKGGLDWNSSGAAPTGTGQTFTTPIIPGQVQGTVIFTNAATYATATLQLPCGAPDGYVQHITASAFDITTLTVARCASNTDTVYGGTVAPLSPTTPAAFRYILPSTSWVRE